MVIGLPRSGTTWAANFLSTDDCLVVHDPLNHTHYSDWGAFDAVSCTGIWRWPAWVNAQQCPKIILERDEAEVMSALERAGAGGIIQAGDSRRLHAIGGGYHMHWRRLFDPAFAKLIWSLAHPGRPFPALRHRELCNMNVQPKLGDIRPDRDVMRRLISEL